MGQDIDYRLPLELRCIELVQVGMQIQVAKSRAAINWEDIKQIEEFNKYHIIPAGNNYPFLTYVITPYKIFTVVDSFDEVFQAWNEYKVWRNSNTGKFLTNFN